jgi:hypothetical protein
MKLIFILFGLHIFIANSKYDKDQHIDEHQTSKQEEFLGLEFQQKSIKNSFKRNHQLPVT